MIYYFQRFFQGGKEEADGRETDRTGRIGQTERRRSTMAGSFEENGGSQRSNRVEENEETDTRTNQKKLEDLVRFQNSDR